MVRQRWAMAGGAPKKVTVMMDSTVVVRYGRKQAGAERGYNPKKRGRPSHHPLPACVRETGTAWACSGGRAARTPPRELRSGWSGWWDG